MWLDYLLDKLNQYVEINKLLQSFLNSDKAQKWKKIN